MISERLKQLRENKGYNMRQMAAALNLPYTTYVNYEKGEREPNSEQLILFSKYFDVSIDYIIGITNDIKSCEPPNTNELNIEERTKSTFQERLKEAMELRSMGQSDLVQITGLSKPRISQYVNGVYEAKQQALYVLAKALNVNISWLMGNDVPMEINYDKLEEESRACEIFEKCYGTDIFDIVKVLIKLDTFDRQLILNMIDGMLKAEKYTEKKPQLTTIYRAARSDDNHPPEIVETEKDFSKIPTTKNSKL